MKHTIIFPFLFCFVTTLIGQVTHYSDRASWEAAVSGICFEEDFSGFTSDTEFRSGPVQCNGFTLEQTGTDQFFRNEIDVIPLNFTDNNGTNAASMFVNDDDIGVPGTRVTLTFDTPGEGFFADFYGAASGEILMLVIDATTGNMIDSHVITMNTVESFGFIVDSGGATRIVFESMNNNPGGGGEGFTMDDVSISCAAVPTMSQWSLIILGLFLLIFGIAVVRQRTISVAYK